MALPKDEFRVLIIGAGNCGLAIATGLKKAGIPATVFERSTQDDFLSGAKDWGSILHWGSEYLEKIIPAHLHERLNEVQADINIPYGPPSPLFNAETGEVIKRIDAPNIRKVTRMKIRKFLYRGENHDIQFGKRLKAITTQDDSVEAEFEDGTKVIGSMIVGCDGSRSAVREFLVGKEAGKIEDAGQTMINYTTEGYTPETAHFLRSFHPITQLAFDHSKVPGAALLGVLEVPDPEDPTSWKFQIWTGWGGPPVAKDLQDVETRKKFVRDRMSQFCEPFRTAALSAPDVGVMPVFPGHQWAPRMEWDNHGGKVTIAGDAAHAMLPHRGQGLNNAFKDASDIVDAIKAAVAGTQSLADGITAYEVEMRARGTEEVDMSYQQMLATERRELADSPLMKKGFSKN